MPHRLAVLYRSCLVIFVFTSASLAFATVFGSVQGIVHDAQHRPIAGAKVEIRAAAADWKRETTTDDNGEYHFNAVPVGQYVMAASADGFATLTRKVIINSGTSPSIHFGLEVATVEQTVQVAAQPETVNPQSSTTESLVSRNQITSTPGADSTNSMAMITNLVPGSYIVHDQLHIRGGHQVTWMLDGVPLPNTNIASNVGPQVDPKDIEYLEVQRGGLSSEVGDRTYGAFNVVPRAGFDRTREAELVASYGSFQQTNDQLSFGSHTQRLGYYGSISGYRTDLGLETPVPEVIHDQAAGLSTFGSTIYNITPADQLRFVGSIRGDHYQVPNDPDQQTAGIRDVNNERDAFGIASWVHTVDTTALFTVSPFYHYNRADYIGGPNDPISPLDKRHSDYVGGHATAVITAAQHTARFGIDGFAERQNERFGITFTDGSQPNVDARQTTWGSVAAAFAEDQFRATSWLTLNAGVRLTDYSGLINETAADPRVGAALRLGRLGWVLRGFYGRYFQPPPLSTLGGALLEFAQTQGLGFLPLHGERDQQFEVGLAAPILGWTVDVNAFQTRAKNFFDHDAIGNSNIFVPLTIERARIRGVEGTLRSPRIARVLDWHLAYSHQFVQGKGEVTGGLSDFAPLEDIGYFYLDHDQRNTLSTGVQWNTPHRSWVSANLAYGSGFLDEDGPAHLPSHAALDLALGKDFGERWSAKLTALNITNSRFLIDNSNTFGGTHWANPREVAVQVRYRFHY